MTTKTPSVSTYGLTHLALGVKNPDRAFAFYSRVFGMVAVYREIDFIQAQTPGGRDVLVLQRAKRGVGKSGGVAHFGFRVTESAHIARAVTAVRAAGGTVVEEGEFVAGEPYAFFRDLDGYTVEVWYELPTAVDPKPSRGRRSASRRRRLTRS